MELDLEPPYLIIRPGFTEEEFYRLAGADSDWEFLDGRIVMHSPASYRHENLFSFLMTLLRGFLDERGGGVVLGSRFPMRLDPSWSPEPDLLVVLAERLHRLTTQRLEGPADLVVEIVSESDRQLIHLEKLPRYRQELIPEIWIVDPFRKEVLVETLGPAGYASRTVSAGRLESAVVSGFWIDAGWLWQERLPSTMSCLREVLGHAS